MSDVIQLARFLGMAIACADYLPQISHLIREKCSAGISIRAWSCGSLPAY